MMCLVGIKPELDGFNTAREILQQRTLAVAFDEIRSTTEKTIELLQCFGIKMS
jgi:hypothetical protein